MDSEIVLMGVTTTYGPFNHDWCAWRAHTNSFFPWSCISAPFNFGLLKFVIDAWTTSVPERKIKLRTYIVQGEETYTSFWYRRGESLQVRHPTSSKFVDRRCMQTLNKQKENDNDEIQHCVGCIGLRTVQEMLDMKIEIVVNSAMKRPAFTVEAMQ